MIKHNVLILHYYEYDRLCSVIRADYAAETVQVENYCDKPIKTAFGNCKAPTWAQYEEFLESRCIPRERDGLREYLAAIGVAVYDPLAIIRVTKGKMAEDHQWLTVEEEVP